MCTNSVQIVFRDTYKKIINNKKHNESRMYNVYMTLRSPYLKCKSGYSDLIAILIKICPFRNLMLLSYEFPYGALEFE